MKYSACNVAHEICEEIQAKCVLCGGNYSELHHFPKRHKKGGVPEILYITLWPVCKTCHDRDPNMDKEKLHGSIVNQLSMQAYAREHVMRCYARGVYNK